MRSVTDKNISMDRLLTDRLDDVAYNLNRDWDCVYLISGDGMTRIGKSILAQQICYYVSQKMGTPFTMKNIVFSGDELIERGHKLPKNSVILYDEARGDLDNKRVIESNTKKILDFFSECGMYNHFFVLNMPDFFDYPKSIAILRSEALINVYRKEVPKTDKAGKTIINWQRGQYEFFTRKRKKKLYLMGKKTLDYGIHVGTPIYGQFNNKWILDYDKYAKIKLEYITRDRQRKTSTDERVQVRIYKQMVTDGMTIGKTQEQISKLLCISRRTLVNYNKTLGLDKHSIKVNPLDIEQ